MKTKLALIILLLLLNSALIAYPATIQFKNGDKITGNITAINSETIQISSEILGLISVPIDKVDTIVSENLYKITTEDGREYIGKLNYKNGSFSISQKKKPSTIDTANLKKIEPLPETKENTTEKKKWSGEIKALASFQRGTVDSSNFEGRAKVERQTKNDRLSTEFWGNYSEVEGDINARRYGGNLRYTHYPKERLYLYGETNAERDESRKLGLRYQIGGGTGYDVIKKEKQNLSLEGALLFTYEEYLPFIPYEKDKEKEKIIKEGVNQITTSTSQISQNPQNIPAYGGIISGVAILLNPLQNYEKTHNDFASLKVGSNFTQKVLSSTLTNKLSLQTNLDRLEHYRFISDTTLSTPLHNNLSLEISLSNEYDSNYKNRSIDAWEHRLSTGIKYEFR